MGELLKSLGKHYTNHSLRRSSTSRLFQKGIDSKLIRAFTRYRSDALYQYETISEGQHEEMSKIIQGDDQKKFKLANDSKESALEIGFSSKSGDVCMSCRCTKQQIKESDVDKIGSIVD